MEMWLSADTSLWFLDRLSIGCSAEWSMALGLRTVFLNPSLDLALLPVTLSCKRETENNWISGPCCMIIPPEMPAEGKVQNMSDLSKYRGRRDVETMLVWTGMCNKGRLRHGCMRTVLSCSVQGWLTWLPHCYVSEETDVYRPARQTGTRVSWQLDAADAMCLPAGWLIP